MDFTFGILWAHYEASSLACNSLFDIYQVLLHKEIFSINDAEHTRTMNEHKGPHAHAHTVHPLDTSTVRAACQLRCMVLGDFDVSGARFSYSAVIAIIPTDMWTL